MTKTRRGDVVLVLFRNSDLRTAKRRCRVQTNLPTYRDKLKLLSLILTP